MSSSTAPAPATAGVVASYLTERVGTLPVEVRVDVDHLGLRNHLTRVDDPADDRDPTTALTLPVRIYGRTAIVGPVGAAGRPCVHCLERRWQELRPEEERRALHRGQAIGTGVIPALPTALDRLWQVARFLLVQPPTAPDTALVYEVGLDSARVRPHLLLADSLCPRCATPEPDSREAATLALQPRPKPAPDRYRLRPASDYPLTGYVDPACGPLGSMAMRLYQFSATAPVSGLFRVRSRYDLHEMWWSGHADSFSDSERYGILEGLERYAGQQPRSRAVTVHDSFANLAPDALDPRDCGEYRPGFYSGRHHYQPFTEDLRMPWVWGYSLRDDRPRLVPEQLVYYLDRNPGQTNFVQECSNGCASGSCPEEALLYGLLELVERDAFLLCWYSAHPLPEIDIRSVRDPQVHFMRERVGLLGYDVRLFDLRADLPVPVVMALAIRRDGGLGRLCFAAGSGLDPEDAVRAALCETASYVAGFDERVANRLDEVRGMVTDYERVGELSHHALLYGLPEMAPHAQFLLDDPTSHPIDELYADWRAAYRPGDDLTEDLRYLVDAVAQRGSDVLAVDQTCPEQRRSGVHTMAVIAPGLIPIDFGWARQRVLHHPRFAGWLRRTGKTPHLHPHPFP
ncbi:hypothetical protein GCM10027290_03030 [Micromonospora sonneratiae]|uniref:TOMM leader peptide-binding protein n=1 Tax=Micromonospora sonneratiae TaxID=1184706 RepID=A0ABW3Y7L6_9ACTN